MLTATRLDGESRFKKYIVWRQNSLVNASWTHMVWSHAGAGACWQRAFASRGSGFIETILDGFFEGNRGLLPFLSSLGSFASSDLLSDLLFIRISVPFLGDFPANRHNGI